MKKETKTHCFTEHESMWELGKGSRGVTRVFGRVAEAYHELLTHLRSQKIEFTIEIFILFPKGLVLPFRKKAVSFYGL